MTLDGAYTYNVASPSFGQLIFHRMTQSVALINLGCPKNLVDAEVMLGHLAVEGFEITADVDAADVVIVNTCGFLADAAQESIDTMLRLASTPGRSGPRRVIAAGCMAQRYGTEAAAELPEVDAFVGVGQAHRMPDIVRRTLAGERPVELGSPSAGFEGYGVRMQATPAHTAYLKISEGCDRACAFCVIPSIRGKMQSRPRRDLVNEARMLADQGVRELVLIGQDPVRYGADLGAYELPRLLEDLNDIEGLRWIRLMYLFPDRHALPVIEAVARLPRVCSYIDMPIQHVSRRVLRAMGRPGEAAAYGALVSRLRELDPTAMFRTTFIAGHPGETEEDFQELLNFVEFIEPDWGAAFVYSPEETTAAAELAGQIPQTERRRRWRQLLDLQQQVTARRLRRWLGRRVEVLIERREGDRAHGRMAGQAPDIDGEVILSLDDLPDAAPGDFVQVEIQETTDYDFLGRAVSLQHRSPRRSKSLLTLHAAPPGRSL